MTGNQPFQQELSKPKTDINLSIAERWLSIFSGGALAALAFRQRGAWGVILGVVAWYFANRGLYGHCAAYDFLDINTAVKTNPDAVSVPHEQGIHVVKSVVIDRSPEELYEYWRNFENLPNIMRHVQSVTASDDTHSHWVVKGPAGKKLEWDAEIINDIPFNVIAWRSLPDADVSNAGSVRFRETGSSTEVEVTLEYVPPAGKLGQVVAALLGKQPEIQIEDDLNRFKQLAETGQTVNGWMGVDEGGDDDKKTKKKPADVKHTPDYNQPADQAEGERSGDKSSKVSKTPGQAEG